MKLPKTLEQIRSITENLSDEQRIKYNTILYSRLLRQKQPKNTFNK